MTLKDNNTSLGTNIPRVKQKIKIKNSCSTQQFIKNHTYLANNSPMENEILLLGIDIVYLAIISIQKYIICNSCTILNCRPN